MSAIWQGWGEFWENDRGQDIAEYAILLALLLVVVIATVRLVGEATRRNLDKAEDVLQTPRADD